MIPIYAVNINPFLNDHEIEHLLQLLPKEKRARILRYHFKEDQRRGLTGEILVRFMLNTVYEIKPDDFVFSTNKYGKPELSINQEIYFNKSHSGDWVIAATDKQPIGIDIEKIKEISLDIAKRFFSEKEVCDLKNKKSGKESSDYFFDLWTLKESYIKNIGKGLSQPLNSFSFQIKERSIFFTADQDKRSYYFRQYPIDPNYKLSVCARNNAFPDKIEIYSPQKLYENYIKLVKKNVIVGNADNKT